MAEIPGSQYGKRENSLSNADSPGGLDNKKRKVASANTSSRGVANLTPEQLAKKRQNVGMKHKRCPLRYASILILEQ